MAHVIIHFEIPAGDMDRARRFYGDLFGWTFRERQPLPEEGGAYALIDCGGQGPNGGLLKRTTAGQGILNYFLVENVDAYAERAKSLGAAVVADKRAVPGLGWWAVLRDTEGNAFAIWQDDTAAE